MKLTILFVLFSFACLAQKNNPKNPDGAIYCAPCGDTQSGPVAQKSDTVTIPPATFRFMIIQDSLAKVAGRPYTEKIDIVIHTMIDTKLKDMKKFLRYDIRDGKLIIYTKP